PRGDGRRRSVAQGFHRLGAAAAAPAARAPDPRTDGGERAAQPDAIRGSRRVIRRDAVPFIGPRDQQRFEQLLTWYTVEGGLRAALLVDRTGRLLACVGEADFDRTTFATLVAADFAAGDQLALLLGEEEVAALCHQGENRSMYLSDVGG